MTSMTETSISDFRIRFAIIHVSKFILGEVARCTLTLQFNTFLIIRPMLFIANLLYWLDFQQSACWEAGAKLPAFLCWPIFLGLILLCIMGLWYLPLAWSTGFPSPHRILHSHMPLTFIHDFLPPFCHIGAEQFSSSNLLLFLFFFTFIFVGKWRSG